MSDHVLNRDNNTQKIKHNSCDNVAVSNFKILIFLRDDNYQYVKLGRATLYCSYHINM